MKPIAFPEANKTLTAPPGLEETVVPLPVFTDGNQCISCWQPDEEERTLIAMGANIWMHVLAGESQPPIGVRIDHKFA